MAQELLNEFGIKKIQSKYGEESIMEFLKDTEIIGFYFSAHWCPPCRGFTPTLAKYYTGLKAVDAPIKIIFVSSDRDKAGFDDYYKDMPWHAVPFENHRAKAKMANKYGVRGIPCLIIVGKDGKIIDSNGRQTVAKCSTDAHVMPKAWQK